MEATPRSVPPNTVSSLTGLWWLRNLLAVQESTGSVLPPPGSLTNWAFLDKPSFYHCSHNGFFIPRVFFLTGPWPLPVGWGGRLAVGSHGGWGFSVGTAKKAICVWTSALGSSADPSDSSSQQTIELLIREGRKMDVSFGNFLRGGSVKCSCVAQTHVQSVINLAHIPHRRSTELKSLRHQMSDSAYGFYTV